MLLHNKVVSNDILEYLQSQMNYVTPPPLILHGIKVDSNVNIPGLWLDDAVIFTVLIPRLKYHEYF
jgi:hypothetical protein